jgi:hypothetical protein
MNELCPCTSCVPRSVHHALHWSTLVCSGIFQHATTTDGMHMYAQRAAGSAAAMSGALQGRVVACELGTNRCGMLPNKGSDPNN